MTHEDAVRAFAGLLGASTRSLVASQARSGTNGGTRGAHGGKHGCSCHGPLPPPTRVPNAQEIRALEAAVFGCRKCGCGAGADTAGLSARGAPAGVAIARSLDGHASASASANLERARPPRVLSRVSGATRVARAHAPNVAPGVTVLSGPGFDLSQGPDDGPLPVLPLPSLPTLPDPGSQVVTPPQCVPRFCAVGSPGFLTAVPNCVAEQGPKGPPYWLAADGARAIPLTTNRFVHLFGDTALRKADGSFFYIANSVGVGRCATVGGKKQYITKYFWREGPEGGPQPIFAQPEPGGHPTTRFWPVDGFVHEGRMFVLLGKVRSTGPLTWVVYEYVIATVHNPLDEPSKWCITYAHLLDGPHADEQQNPGVPGDPNKFRDFRSVSPGLGLVPPGPHTGNYVHIFGTLLVDWVGSADFGTAMVSYSFLLGSPAVLLRIPVNRLAGPSRLFAGPSCGKRSVNLRPSLEVLDRWMVWRPIDTVPMRGDANLRVEPGEECYHSDGRFLSNKCHRRLQEKSSLKIVVESPGTEHYVHRHPNGRGWVAIRAMGAGQELGVQPSTNLWGGVVRAPGGYAPWDPPTSIFPFPELQGATPSDFALCYAVTEHPAFRTSGHFVASYACNRLAGSAVISPSDIDKYLPKTVIRKWP